MAETRASTHVGPAVAAELVAGVLLPGDGAAWPSAGALGLGAAIGSLLPPGLGDRLAAALPSDFARRDMGERTAACALLERTQPDLFAALLRAAYQAYYAHPAVRATALALSAARASRPLSPFDPTRLDPVRRRFGRAAARLDQGARPKEPPWRPR